MCVGVGVGVCVCVCLCVGVCVCVRACVRTVIRNLFDILTSICFQDMGTVVMGKVESGAVMKGASLLLMPNRVSGLIRD